MIHRAMRYSITKEHSTKAERRVYEVLKGLKIPFRFRWRIGKYEVDFLIGKTALDIDGHSQDAERNTRLAELGYTPIHLANEETKDTNKVKDLIKRL